MEGIRYMTLNPVDEKRKKMRRNNDRTRRKMRLRKKTRNE